MRLRKPVRRSDPGGTRRILACPACGGALALHPHPAEKFFFPGVLLALLGLNIYSGFSGIKISPTGAVLMLALIFAAAFAVRRLLVPKDWRRYVADRSSKD
ncbi:hypothetical protein [Propionivibrio dicarboxylicus]|uniref:hypothetical protein n=1 Tax=Propionivibrio dicarboxylicus TaxID=83767 RepID=UPI00115FDA3A|nr:hypothetical protein [Propionivibrio dicarboxylicus]